MPTLSGHNTKLEGTEAEEGSEEIKEGEMPKAALDALKKHKEKSEDKNSKAKDVEETMDAGEDSKMADKKKEVNQKTANVSEMGTKMASYKMKKEETASIDSAISLTLEFTDDSNTVAAFSLNSSDKSSCPAIKALTCSAVSSFFILYEADFIPISETFAVF